MFGNYMKLMKTLLSLLSLTLSTTVFGQLVSPIRAPNVVAISDKLVTGGQPNAESLTRLSELGFQAVIYLAPPTVADAIANESDIIRNQGIEFINIPITWSEPTEAHFKLFSESMKRLQGKKVLVHCQANMRASAFTFLYRVIVNGENPNHAYEDVQKVWTPKNQWKDFMNSQLQKSKISFNIQ
jgi:protein tyrosine phosphatase (PTP) superfamily phosphohydrolase (DUF442 family)